MTLRNLLPFFVIIVVMTTNCSSNGHEFGKAPSGETVELYTLKNAKGIEAGISTYGGVLVALKVPDRTPGWLTQLGTATVRPFAWIDEWIMRRPWEAIRVAMQEELADFSWTELFFGTAFLAAGSRSPGTFGVRPRGSGHQ